LWIGDEWCGLDAKRVDATLPLRPRNLADLR
jgi:hypothetical protein